MASSTGAPRPWSRFLVPALFVVLAAVLLAAIHRSTGTRGPAHPQATNLAAVVFVSGAAVFCVGWEASHRARTRLAREVAEHERVIEELHEARAILQAAMDQSQAGIAIADAPDGRLRYVNRAGLMIRGGDEKTLVEAVDASKYASAWRVFHDDGTPYEPDEVPLSRAILHGETCSREILIRREGGEDRVVWTNAAPIRDDAGRVRAGIAVFLDVTDRKRVEDDLRASERLLLDVERVAGLGHYTLDLRTGRWTSSDLLDEIFGIGPDFDRTVEGWVSLIHPDFRGEMTRYLSEEVVGKRQRFEREYLAVRPSDGDERWLHGFGRLETDAGGNVVRMIGAIQDVTARKRAEQLVRESTESLRRVIEGSPFPIRLNADDGEILLVNRAWCRLTGYAPEELRTISDWTEKAYGDRKDAARADIDSRFSLAEATHEGEFAVRTKDGGERIWDFSAAPLGRMADGRQIATTMAMDVTGRRRAEAEVQRLNAELEERVRQRTAQLESANKEMEAFSYSVAHDLRAPVRAIDGFAAMLDRDHAGALDEKGKRLLSTVRKNAHRMGTLIDDLLHFSRTSRVQMKRTPIDMTRTVNEALSEVIPAARKERLRVRVGELPPATGDQALVRVAVQNLLANAVKFSAPREHPTIEVGSRSSPDGSAYFVRDNGVGFDRKYVGKLFGVFQRLHGMDEFTGTGIGLALVKRIVERHGGQVWAEGEVDRGATFWFTLGAEPDPGPKVP